MSKSHSITESDIYSSVLKTFTWFGFIVLLVLFCLYVFRLLDPNVPFDRLLDMWAMSAEEANRTFNRPTGWQWLGRLNQGDVLCNCGIVILCSATIISALASVPAMIKEKKHLYAFILFLISCVLILAASGIVSGGH